MVKPTPVKATTPTTILVVQPIASGTPNISVKGAGIHRCRFHWFQLLEIEFKDSHTHILPHLICLNENFVIGE